MQPSPESQQLRVVACPHPFKLANHEYSFAPAISLTQILQEVQPDTLLCRRAHIWVNDKYIDPGKWDSTFPEAGAKIDIRVVPSGGAGRIIGTVLVAIAAIAAAVFLGPVLAGAIGFGSPMLWGSLVGLAVGVVGNLALNALFPPARPGSAGTISALSAIPGQVDYGQSSPTLSITGAQNKANLWGPVPFILGRFRVAPFYGARTYTESSGGDQYLRLLFVWCFAPVQLEDLRILDTLLENYQGVEVEHRNLTLLLSAQTVAIDVTAKTLTRTTGSWLMEGITAGNTVTLAKCTTTDNDTDYLISNVTALVLTFTTSTATTTEPGNGAQTATIVYGDDDITLYPVTIEETVLSIELEQDVENTQTSELDADELSIDIACNGLRGMTTTGGTYELTVNFTVTYRETGTSGAWLATDNIVMTGNTKSAVRGNLRWKPPARGQYDIKVKRTTAADTIWTLSVSYWVALRTIKNEDPIDFPHPLAKTAMRIKATGQLNGTVEEFKGTLTSICPDWDVDTETWITRTTQNPASLYRKVLQGIQNQKPLADSRIDLTNLQDWHEYCEEPDRNLTPSGVASPWRFNKYIDYSATVEDLLREIAAAARSTYSRIDSKVGVIIDEPQAFTIGPAFTPRNILKDSFQSNIAIVDRPHAFRCPFINEDMQYQQDERIVLADGYQIDNLDAWGVSHPEYPAATIFEQLDLPGVTDPELVFCHARYHYAVATLRCETIQFGTDFEWLVATRGDRIKFAHDVMLVGLSWGRVKSLVMEIIGYTEDDPPEPIYSGYLAGVTTDELLPMEAGTNYVLRFRLADNTSLLCPIVTAAGEPKEATFTTPIAGGGDWPAVDDLFLFGEADLEAIDLIIKSIQPNSDLSATLVALPYDPNIYLADVGTIPAHDPKISAPVEWWLPVISWVRSDGTVLFPIPGGGWQSRILVTLLRPSALNSQITGVECQFWVTGSEESPTILPVVDLDVGEVSILPVTDGQSYDFRLRYVKKDGSRGPWCSTETEVVEGKTAPPSDVTGFYVMQLENLITARWTNILDLDRSDYEIRYGEVGESWEVGIIANGEYRGNSFTTTDIPAGTWDVMIKAFDTSRNESVTEARKTLQVYQFYTVLSSVEQRPLWGGTLANLVRNPLTGNLNPDDQDIPDGDDFDVFDSYVVNPYSDISYTTPEIDLGSDKVARAWARIYSNLGVGETGIKAPLLSLDYKLDGGAYDGFEEWGIGYFEGRYVKFKVSIDPDIGLLRLTGFQPTIDQAA